MRVYRPCASPGKDSAACLWLLSQQLLLVYTTHMLLEGVNLGIVCYIACLLAHSTAVASRSLYTVSLYVEMVWLLVPSAAVGTLIARVLVMQTAEEEVHTVC